MRVEWTESMRDSLCVVHLRGEIDLQHSPRMRELLQSKAQEQVAILLLDFSEVRYIDSSGLATLVEYYRNSRVYSGKVALAGLSARVRSIFELVRFNEIFPIFTTIEEAQKELGIQA